MSSKTIGSGLASLGALIFFYYTAWIFVIPFLDQTHWLHLCFIDRIWAVRIPQVILSFSVSLLVLFVLFKAFCPIKFKVSLHPVN